MNKRRALVAAVVVLLHGLLLAAAAHMRVEPVRPKQLTLTVELISEPTVVREAKPPAIRSEPLVAPMPVVLVATPTVQIPVVEAAPVMSVVNRPAPPASVQAASENLGAALLVQCPERTPPRYPPLSKRLHEQGEVRLRVELDENGRIDRVTIVRSSGSERLDEAARTAIQSWRCRPARLDGRPVRAVALQSLAFELDRH